MAAKTNPITSAFDAEPPDTENVGLGATRMREERGALKEVTAEEHELNTSESTVEHGRHLMGAAVCYVSETAPTLRPNGVDALTKDDVGRMWLKPDMTNTAGGFILYVYLLTDDQPGTVNDVYEWKAVGRMDLRINQDVRDTASPEFVGLHITGSASFDQALSGTITTALTANKIRTTAPTPPAVGDIWMA
jgi:hypothetical protein